MTQGIIHKVSAAKGVARARQITLEVSPGVHIPAVVLANEDGTPIDANHPIQVDGDSIYAKDINADDSDLGTFSGNILDLVDSLSDSIADDSAASPKWFKIKLRRPVQNSSIKFCSPIGTDFSNVKISLYDNAGVVVGGSDHSWEDTKYTSYQYDWALTPWCTLLVEFYTVDPVAINWMIAEKSQNVHALIQSQQPDDIVRDVSFEYPLPTTAYDTEISFEESAIRLIEHKYGRNIDVGTVEEDLHGLGGLINWLQAPTVVRIKAGGNAADTAAGAGARSVRVYGIDSNLNFADELIATNGASASLATTTLFWRVFRARVETVGTYGVANTGVITIENAAGDTDLIQIAAGEGGSQYGAYSIPQGYKAILKHSHLSVDSGKAVNIRLWSRAAFNDVVAPMSPKTNRAQFDGISVPFSWETPIKLAFSELTDLWWSAAAVATSAKVSVAFCMELRPIVVVH